MHIKLLFFLFILVLANYNCNYSKSSNNANRNIFTEKWQEIKVYDLTFSIPRDMTKQDLEGRDNLALRYANDEISVSLESGIGSETLNKLENADYLKNFQRKQVVNKNINGIQIDYQFLDGKTNFADPNKKFAKVVSFDCEKENNSVTFTVLFAHSETNDIAQRIINSISLNCSQ